MKLAAAKDELNKYYDLSSVRHFKEITYFSPDGKKMPNGVAFQRGGFLHECKENADKFVVDKGIHPAQDGLNKYRGGHYHIQYK